MKKKLTLKRRSLAVLDPEKLGGVAGGNTEWNSVCGPNCSNNYCPTDGDGATCDDTCENTCADSCGGTCDSCTCDPTCPASCGDTCGASCGTGCGLCPSENNNDC